MSTKKKWPPSEAALCEVLVDWLEAEGWEVYQEVQYHGGIADIVAVRGGIVWVVEAKTGYNMTVMEQAYNWLNYAHLVSIATPSLKRRKGHFMADSILRYYGIGRLVVPAPFHFKGQTEIQVTQEIFPIYHRKRKVLKSAVTQFKDSLLPEHKTWAKAGVQHGRRVTTFGLTREAVKKVVAKYPGITLHDLVEKVDHHYSSKYGARQYIALYIDNGVIDGIRIDRDGKRLRLYPL